MSGIKDHQVLDASTFGWSGLRFGDLVTDASAHSGSRPSTRTLDPSVSDGAYRNQPGFTSYSTTTPFPAIPSRITTISTQGRKLDFPQCHQRQSTKVRAQDCA
jgi:hypothetical protein